MRILVTNPPWMYRRGLRKYYGVRVGSRWPFSYEIPTAYSRARNFMSTLKPATPSGMPVPHYVPYPSFMGYAVSFLKSKGVDAVFYDAGAEVDSYKRFYETVDKIKPDIVIQETASATNSIDLNIAQRLHRKYEVCLVGPHATACAERLAELPYVDYVLKGTYELSSLKMAQTKRKGIYEYESVDLDSLPYPYRDEKIIHNYRDYNCLRKLAFPQLWVYAGMGCAYHCDFCLWVHVMFNKKLRLRRAENVIDEIDNMVVKYGFRHIYFDDDCWNLGSEERLMKMADGLKRIGLPWTINARMDTSAKEMFRYFVDRGCAALRLGVESLSQNLLDITSKDLKVETILEKIKYLEKLDVELYLLFMHYVPGETRGDREEQKRQIAKLGHRFQNSPCIPFPGTPYYEKVVEAGFDLRKIDWSEFDSSSDMNQLLKAVKEYGRRFAPK